MGQMAAFACKSKGLKKREDKHGGESRSRGRWSERRRNGANLNFLCSDRRKSEFSKKKLGKLDYNLKRRRFKTRIETFAHKDALLW